MRHPAEDEGAAIIVTGSRIQRADFENNSPTVTVDEALLQNSSTAALETNLNKLPQFTPAKTPQAGADIQPTATNTPGAATISLRGIGSNRNLVLLDGRRGTPSNASGVIDITTIPSAAIQRVEIISGGASATYGADAVAGVTNFILKKDFQGLELDGQMGLTQEGDGFEYQLSGIMGTDFADGRGNISLAMSMNTREASLRSNRKWYRDLFRDTSTTGGSQFFIDRPGILLDGTSGNYATRAEHRVPRRALQPERAGHHGLRRQPGQPVRQRLVLRRRRHLRCAVHPLRELLRQHRSGRRLQLQGHRRRHDGAEQHRPDAGAAADALQLPGARQLRDQRLDRRVRPGDVQPRQHPDPQRAGSDHRRLGREHRPDRARSRISFRTICGRCSTAAPTRTREAGSFLRPKGSPTPPSPSFCGRSASPR